LFRDAVKAITRGDDDDPPPPRRRRGETEGDFRKLALKVSRRFDVLHDFRRRAAITSRYLTIPAEAYAVATTYLAGAFDMLNHWNNDAGDDVNEDFNAVQEHISPHL
jgi:hypothetical protein